VRVSGLVINRARRQGIELTAWHDSTLQPPVDLPPGPPETTPEVRHIDISDITVSQAPTALQLRGLPERPFHSVTVRGLTSNKTDAGVRCENVENIVLDKISVASAKAPALVVKGARDMEVRQLRSQQPASALPVIELEDAENVTVSPSRLPPGTTKLLALKGTRNAGIVIERNGVPASALPSAPGVISVR
jgi:hypothetical protein